MQDNWEKAAEKLVGAMKIIAVDQIYREDILINHKLERNFNVDYSKIAIRIVQTKGAPQQFGWYKHPDSTKRLPLLSWEIYSVVESVLGFPGMKSKEKGLKKIMVKKASDAEREEEYKLKIMRLVD